jgi:hypothetical protein
MVACGGTAIIDGPLGGGGTGSSNYLAIDESALYWLDIELGTVIMQPREAEAATALASSDTSLVDANVAINEADLFWISYLGSLAVERIPLGGGDVERMAEVVGGPFGIAVDAASLYFTRLYSSLVPDETDPRLVEVSLETGRERVIADSRPALAVAIDGTDIFATSCGLNGVWRVPRSGGEPVTLVEDTHCALALALDDQSIYFADRVVHEARSTQMGVFRVPRIGGAPELVTHTDGLSFAVLDGYVYTVRDGILVRARADGSSVTELAPAAPRVGGIPAAVAVDDRLAYWTEPDDTGALVLRSIPLPDD